MIESTYGFFDIIDDNLFNNVYALYGSNTFTPVVTLVCQINQALGGRTNLVEIGRLIRIEVYQENNVKEFK